MTPAAADNSAAAYHVIAEAIRFLAANRHDSPSLATLAGHLGLSASHLQRVFSLWAGVSPKQYLQFLAREEAVRRLRESSVLDAALASGLSGGGRLHDLVIAWEGATPGEIRRGGAGLSIRYGLTASPFGPCFIASTSRGICKLAFFDRDEDLPLLERELREAWPAAQILRDDAVIENFSLRIFPPRSAAQPGAREPLHLLLRGSEFQRKVWEALLSIPEGELRSYQQMATAIGQPKSVRAVASAIARNDIGYLIPCHRVIRGNGGFGQYRWGEVRKQAMIGREACFSHAVVAPADAHASLVGVSVAGSQGRRD